MTRFLTISILLAGAWSAGQVPGALAEDYFAGEPPLASSPAVAADVVADGTVWLDGPAPVSGEMDTEEMTFEEACSGSDKLFGFIAPSDHCFDSFISPQSNPLFFEDPRTLTEVRFHFVHHKIPLNQPVLQGGEARFYAMQARIALTERLSIIATKDGYIDLNANNPAIGSPNGWADIAAGLKYNLIRDPECQRLLSGGFTYEIDLGTHRVFQGRGDGEFHFFLTGGQQIGSCAHWVSGSGFRIPTDSADRSQMWYWSNHFDYEFRPGWYAVYEVNWFHWMKSGAGALGTSGFEGGDLFNLGSTGVAGNDIVTMSLGGRYKPKQNVELGVAYEAPVTERRDLLEHRIYIDAILRF
jgi:hypothetical protein